MRKKISDITIGPKVKAFGKKLNLVLMVFCIIECICFVNAAPAVSILLLSATVLLFPQKKESLMNENGTKRKRVAEIIFPKILAIILIIIAIIFTPV